MSVLRAVGVRAGYGDRDVVRGVDLEVGEGSVLAILGPNGAGKSTLLRLLAGILPVRAGRIELAGRPLQAWRRREIARTLAFVPQQVHFTFPLTVREVVEQGRAPHLGPWRPLGPADRAAVAASLERVRLAPSADTPVQRLSGGERQRVLLARALATQARLLLLDEPAAGLDVRHQLDLLETLRGLASDGVGVVAVLHDWNLAARLADRVAVLGDGAIHAQGRAEEVLTAEMFRAVFSVEVAIEARNGGARVIVPLTSSKA
ncbi:MAG: ABC transporter ATP-binding protein [Acidobacteriota bacterium]